MIKELGKHHLAGLSIVKCNMGDQLYYELHWNLSGPAWFVFLDYLRILVRLDSEVRFD
jgi:hypothetical protein